MSLIVVFEIDQPYASGRNFVSGTLRMLLNCAVAQVVLSDSNSGVAKVPAI